MGLAPYGNAQSDQVRRYKNLILDELGRLPDNLNASPAALLVTIFDEDTMLSSLALASDLRQVGLKVATYPEPAKLGKQLKYADRIGTPLAAVLGPDEIANGQVSIKILETREQVNLQRDEVADFIRQILAAR